MALTLVAIREGVRDKYTNQTITDEQLDRYIASAVRMYSNYNAKDVTAELTTVANQQDYDLPAAFLFMRMVEYFPSGQLYADNPTSEYELAIAQPVRYHHVADRVIKNIERQALAESSQGKWGIVGNRTLRLWPTPATVDSFDYKYGAMHTINGGGTGYDDIPPEDLDIVAQLTLAEVLEAVWLDVSTEFDYAEGLQRVTKHFVPGNVSATIDRLRATVKNKYRIPLVAT